MSLFKKKTAFWLQFTQKDERVRNMKEISIYFDSVAQ